MAQLVAGTRCRADKRWSLEVATRGAPAQSETSQLLALVQGFFQFQQQQQQQHKQQQDATEKINLRIVNPSPQQAQPGQAAGQALAIADKPEEARLNEAGDDVPPLERKGVDAATGAILQDAGLDLPKGKDKPKAKAKAQKKDKAKKCTEAATPVAKAKKTKKPHVAHEKSRSQFLARSCVDEYGSKSFKYTSLKDAHVAEKAAKQWLRGVGKKSGAFDPKDIC